MAHRRPEAWDQAVSGTMWATRDSRSEDRPANKGRFSNLGSAALQVLV